MPPTFSPMTSHSPVWSPARIIDAEGPHALADRLGTADGPGGTVEGGEEAVAGGVHLATPKARDLAARERVVALQQFAPLPVAEGGGPLGRADDVGEEDGG